MITIRLQRRGRKNDPSFRVILVEAKRAAKTGSVNEVLGNYDARTNRVEFKADRIKYWMSMGATVSDTVHNLLLKEKIIEGKKINVLPKKSPPKVEGAAEAATVPTAGAVAAELTPVADAPSADEVVETPAGIVDETPAAEVAETKEGDNSVEA